MVSRLVRRLSPGPRDRPRGACNGLGPGGPGQQLVLQRQSLPGGVPPQEPAVVPVLLPGLAGGPSFVRPVKPVVCEDLAPPGAKAGRGGGTGASRAAAEGG